MISAVVWSLRLSHSASHLLSRILGAPVTSSDSEVGYKVRLTNEDDVVAQIEKVLRDLARDRDLLEQLQQRGVAYAREYLSWEAKAQALTSIMYWTLQQAPKPNLPPPKVLPWRLHVHLDAVSHRRFGQSE